MQKQIALYVHIPFCVKKCNYCDFLSFGADESTKRAYLEALHREVLYWQKIFCGRYRIKTVFIGGGTPTCLEAQELEYLGKIINLFEIDDNAEITIEANPGTLDKEKICAIRKIGVNRVSLGLQSTIDEELKLLGRIHTYNEFLESYHLLRDAGVDNINIDLMSDIPKQSFESYKKTLERVVSLKPEHISSYSLILEPGTVFYKMHEDGVLDIADEDTDRQMYSYTKDFLLANGYHRYEISNYSRKGRECRHNLVYWTLEDYIGIGLGASSCFEGARFSNYSDLEKYFEITKEPGLQIKNIDDFDGDIKKRTETYEKLTPKAKMEEFMFVGLRKCIGVSKTEFKNRFDYSIDEIYGDVIDKFIKNNLLSENDNSDRIYLTDKGIDLSNYILSEFLL